MTAPTPRPLDCDPDAKRWEKEFNDVLVSKGEQPIDPNLMFRWFANAIMCGMDVQRRVLEKEIDSNQAEIRRLREALEKYGEHQRCVRNLFEAGEPTPGGGYRMKFGGEWYQAKPEDETPDCTCGLEEAFAPRQKKPLPMP